MSLVPLVQELLYELHNAKRHLVRPTPCPVTGYVRPWRLNLAKDSGVSRIEKDNKVLKISLDVKHFKPEELNVKVVDNFIIVEGKHEERADEHGFVARQFTRRYHLPHDVDKDAVQSTLSSDNILQITAPKKADKKSMINIPISKINLSSSPLKEPPAEKRMKIEVGA